MTDELRRAMKDAFHSALEGPCLTNQELMFNTACEWLLEHLSKGVEFDEFAARDKWLTMYEEFECGGPVLAVLSLARWQFDQMAARVGLAEEKLAVAVRALEYIKKSSKVQGFMFAHTEAREALKQIGKG